MQGGLNGLRLTAYITQLAFNFMWTPIFFGCHRIFLALLDILLLVWSIVMTIFQFQQVDRVASYMLIPYLLWVTFATCLNASLWWLNSGKITFYYE